MITLRSSQLYSMAGLARHGEDMEATFKDELEDDGSLILAFKPKNPSKATHENGYNYYRIRADGAPIVLQEGEL